MQPRGGCDARGRMPEAIADGETGLLVPPNDEPALADAIVTMLRDPERRRAMGAAGRVRVVREFSIERMVSDTIAVYQRRSLTPKPLTSDL